MPKQSLINDDDSMDSSDTTTTTSFANQNLPPQQFLSLPNNLLDKIEISLSKLEDCNDGF